jgi:hypothetical protein
MLRPYRQGMRWRRHDSPDSPTFADVRIGPCKQTSARHRCSFQKCHSDIGQIRSPPRRACCVGGSSRAIAFAVFRLMIGSYLLAAGPEARSA